MGVIFNNLKPFIAYWISFAVYVMISLLEVFSSKNLIIAFFIVYIISSVLIGCSTNIKEIRFGIILFELQLIVCAIIFFNKYRILWIKHHCFSRKYFLFNIF